MSNTAAPGDVSPAPPAPQSRSGWPEQPASFTEVFPKAMVNVQVGTRKQDVETTVAFDKNTFWLLDPKGKTIKAFPYSSIKTAEYSYSKSPRWKNVGSGAPLVTTGSGNKHWFMVQTQNDYALIALDKDNYRSVVGAFEIRSEKAVEKATESK